MSTNDFLTWLGALQIPAIEGKVKEHAGVLVGPLEVFLWQLTHSFIHGPAGSGGPLKDYARHIQYLSLPLFSHVKKINDDQKPWLDCFPLFGGQSSVKERENALARYLVLYHGLSEGTEIGFSFTGFAGNSEIGLKAVPRFFAVELQTGPASFTIRDNFQRMTRPSGPPTTLLVRASLPRPPRLAQFDDDIVPPAFVASDKTGPAFGPRKPGGQVSPQAVFDWWQGWTQKSLTKTVNQRDDLRKYADRKVVPALSLQAERQLNHRLKTTDRKQVRQQAERLLRFLAWNHALGFSRILYLPFATDNPKGKDTVSWGGLVVALNPQTNLERVLQTLLSTTRVNNQDREIVDMVRIARAFVDLVVQRGVFRDWAQYTNEIELPHQRRTARAAIMSRNLSHNIGSHALANSRLFEAMGVLHLQPAAPNKVEEAAQVRHVTPPANRKRNLTHISKGELWRARERLGTLNSYLQGRMDFIARALGETSSHPEPIFFVNDLLRGFLSQTVLLNTLLSDQGFSCRNIEFHVSLPGSRKPLYFRQRTQADHRGQPARLKDGELRHASLQLDGTESFDDVLVAVPGGMVGRHAFYAFLENLMRNATKYGVLARRRGQATRSNRKLIVHLRLEERSKDADRLSMVQAMPGAKRAEPTRYPCYQLTVLDSLSPDCQFDKHGEPLAKTAGQIAKRIRQQLSMDIIDDQGQLRGQGHGIQEMKVCAQFLAGGDREALVFPHDSAVVRRSVRRHASSPDWEYVDYLRSRRRTEDGTVEAVDMTQPLSIRCFNVWCGPDGTSVPRKRGNHGRPHLAYSFPFLRPVLLGLVNVDRPATPGKTQPPVVFCQDPTVALYGSIQSLAANAAYFGIIVVEGDPSTKGSRALLKCISQLHTALPFRLMLVGDSPKTCRKWRRAIEMWRTQRVESWWNVRLSRPQSRPTTFPLPPRRVHVICCPDLVAYVENHRSVAATAWQAMACRVYEEWLAAFKGDELKQAYPRGDRGRWHLFIGFDRTRETVRQRWLPESATAGSGGRYELSNICVHLYGNDGPIRNGGQRIIECDAVDARSGPRFPQASLILDNHGAVFSFLGSDPGAVASYHTFGVDQPALFEVLFNPPQDAVSRAFLICSVVEALLTQIYVVDERVAEATVEDNLGTPSLFGHSSALLQAARLYPLYTVNVTGRNGRRSRYPLSKLIDDAIKANVKSRRDAATFRREGLHIALGMRRQDIVAAVSLLSKPNANAASSRGHEKRAPDILVIHEGVIDKLKDQKAWLDADHHQLHSICPCVVRTSGRGGTARSLGKELPFVEFSELSDTTYRQMNKVGLAKGLLSLRGYRSQSLVNVQP